MFLVPCRVSKFSFYIYLYPAPCFYFLFLAVSSPLSLQNFSVPCLYLVVLPVPPPRPTSSLLFIPLCLCFLLNLSSLCTLVLLLIPLLLQHPVTPLRPSVLPPAFLFPFIALSCCLWALSLGANSLPGFMCVNKLVLPPLCPGCVCSAWVQSSRLRTGAGEGVMCCEDLAMAPCS